MRRIAHLSDVHILDSRAGTQKARYRLATRFVSLGRGADPKDRTRKLARALASAKANGADHFVISGDLTEVGEESEFEHFAEVLHEAALPAESVTLVPGNHDAYTLPNAWRRALEGPLARFAAGSAGKPGRVVDRGPVVFLPLDTSCFQTIAWSGGLFTKAMTEAVERRLVDPTFRHAAIVLVVHHPPFHPHALPLIRWIDGLRGGAEVLQLLSRHPRLQLLHGHLHRVLDRILSAPSGDGSIFTRAPSVVAHANANARAPIRLFGAPATCESEPADADPTPSRGASRPSAGGPCPYRLYDVHDGALHPVTVGTGQAA